MIGSAQNEGTMKLIFKITLAVLMAVSIAVMAIAEEMTALSPSTDAKFVSRIEKKQECLTDMGESVNGLLTLTKGKPAENEEITLQDSKYVERLQQKLGNLIGDSVRSVDMVKPIMPAPPVFPGNLSPESKFEKSKTEPKEETSK